MSIEVNFAKHQYIWNDCYLGYILIYNNSGLAGLEAIQACLSRDSEFNFYPWLGSTEQVRYPEGGLNSLHSNEFSDLFMRMTTEAIAYGSNRQLSENEIEKLLASFLAEFFEPSFFSNFTNSGWRPVTNNSKDSFLCAIDKNKIGMWLSCDNE